VRRCGVTSLGLGLALAITATLVGGCDDKAAGPLDPQAAAAQPIIKQLREGDPPVRKVAIEQLAAIDHACVVEPLLYVARYDLQSELRVAALRRLPRKELLSPKDIDIVISLAGSPQDEVRLAACEALERLKPPQAEAALAERITDRVSYVRLAALRALSQLGPSGTSRLERMLATGSMDERAAIVELFGRSGDPARIPALLASLKAEEDAVRRAAAEALGNFNEPRVIEGLLELVRKPLSDARLREYDKRLEALPTAADYSAMNAMLDAYRAAEGMRPMGRHDWLYQGSAYKEAFSRLLNRQRGDSQRAVRLAALESLVRLGNGGRAKVIAALGDEDDDVAADAGRILAEDPKATELLYGLLADTRQPAAARMRAVKVLANETPATQPSGSDGKLLEALRRPEASPTTKVIFVPWSRQQKKRDDGIGELSDRLRAALIERLGDKDEALRLFCAKLLASRKIPQAVEPLIGLLHSSKLEVRQQALAHLAHLPDSRAVPRLLEMLRDSANEKLHKPIVVLLGSIRDSKVVTDLLRIATDLKNPLQAEAITALGQIGDPRAGKPLLELYQSLERAAAVTRPATGTAGPNANLQPQLIRVLGYVKCTEAVPTLIGLVRKSIGVGGGVEAMLALGDIGDVSAVDCIIERLRKGPLPMHKRVQANNTSAAGLEALMKLKDPRGVEEIIRLARNWPDEPTRDSAYASLGGIRTAQSAQALIAALVDPAVDMSIKETNVGPALAEVGVVAKEGLLRLLTGPESAAETFDPGIYAAQLLAMMGTEALPELGRIATSNAKPHVLARLIEALQRIDDDQAVTLLGGLLKNPDPQVRQWAAVGLGKMKRPSALPILKAAKVEKDPKVLEWINWAINQLELKE